ncbi:hypothetical protein E7T06_01910 [Deinococcus sp. Arct2-2]|uniref:hypothetical protein n=1 Tax=Deinococcus sp. Arct2-2 TaxID=2568653 RepID=UPI0010A34B92|nr:hypothetical protein [Deinococcus sp. Arct2-2]THF71734.1 hypothetical protein E7T06_01910 [Deinococcus sp. Arct2-2]
MKTPEEIVGGQVHALNATDIDAFMSFWWEDATFYGHPSKLMADGALEIWQLVFTNFNVCSTQATLISCSFLGDSVAEPVPLTQPGSLGPMSSNIAALFKVEGQKIKTASAMVTPAPHVSAMLA